MDLPPELLARLAKEFNAFRNEIRELTKEIKALREQTASIVGNGGKVIGPAAAPGRDSAKEAGTLVEALLRFASE